MNLIKFLVLTAFTLSSTVYASETLFSVKKSLRTSNVLYYKVNLDSQCKLVKKNNKYVDAYWLQDGAGESQREEMSSKEAASLAAKVTYVKGDLTELDFSLGNGAKTESFLSNTEVKVETKKVNNKCQVKAYQEYSGKQVQIKSIWVQIAMLSVDYVVIYGANPDGSAFKKKIIND